MVIALIIVAVLIAILIIYQLIVRSFIIRTFKQGSCIVFGKKGRGKDLFFQHVINITKKEKIANIYYGGNVPVVDLHLFDLGNDFHNVISDNIKKCDKVQQYENHDLFISDAGVYFPSQYDTLLNKEYKSFPIFYALSRHLYNMNIHCNVQNIERLWKSIREQADSYFKINWSIKLPFFFITCYTFYDKYQSAVNDVRPISRGLFSSEEGVERVQNANVGVIKTGFVIIPTNSIKYDTRYFEAKFFNNPTHIPLSPAEAEKKKSATEEQEG